MTIISIDFSILYPGICICKNFKEYKWTAVVNSKISKAHRKNLDDLDSKNPNLSFLYTISKREKKSQYHLTERIKLTNYLESISLILNYLKNEIKDKSDLLIVIEGISFGSSGNALIDISQSTGILKKDLLVELLDGDIDRLFIFSPGELKNSIGCKGNAKKGEIFAKFKTDPILESVKKSDLWKVVNKEDWLVDKKGNIISPIIDMVDSYLGVTKIYQILHEKNEEESGKEQKKKEGR